MSARIGMHRSGIWLIVLTLVAATGCAAPAQAPPAKAAAPAAPAAAPAPAAPAPAPQASGPPANDLLNAVLWMQRSVEYKATTMGAFALARIRLDQALADPNWTALVPKEQTGAYQSLPPAVILDVDETILDNSGYQAWNAVKDTTFDPKTWTTYVNTVTSLAIPGAVEFALYAASQGCHGLLRLEPHRRGGAGDAEEPREVRLPARRHRRHRADLARAAGLDLRQGHAPRLHRAETTACS